MTFVRVHVPGQQGCKYLLRQQRWCATVGRVSSRASHPNGRLPLAHPPVEPCLTEEHLRIVRLQPQRLRHQHAMQSKGMRGTIAKEQVRERSPTRSTWIGASTKPILLIPLIRRESTPQLSRCQSPISKPRDWPQTIKQIDVCTRQLVNDLDVGVPGSKRGSAPKQRDDKNATHKTNILPSAHHHVTHTGPVPFTYKFRDLLTRSHDDCIDGYFFSIIGKHCQKTSFASRILRKFCLSCLLAVPQGILVPGEVHRRRGPIRVQERVSVVVLRIDGDRLRVQLVRASVTVGRVCLSGTLRQQKVKERDPKAKKDGLMGFALCLLTPLAFPQLLRKTGGRDGGLCVCNGVFESPSAPKFPKSEVLDHTQPSSAEGVVDGRCDSLIQRAAPCTVREDPLGVSLTKCSSLLFQLPTNEEVRLLS